MKTIKPTSPVPNPDLYFHRACFHSTILHGDYEGICLFFPCIVLDTCWVDENPKNTGEVLIMHGDCWVFVGENGHCHHPSFILDKSFIDKIKKPFGYLN